MAVDLTLGNLWIGPATHFTLFWWAYIAVAVAGVVMTLRARSKTAPIVLSASAVLPVVAYGIGMVTIAMWADLPAPNPIFDAAVIFMLFALPVGLAAAACLAVFRAVASGGHRHAHG